jgi:hypothetical protein
MLVELAHRLHDPSVELIPQRQDLHQRLTVDRDVEFLDRHRQLLEHPRIVHIFDQ